MTRPPASEQPGSRDPLAEAARRAAQRQKESERQPGLSLGAQLGQIGVLGWTIVAPGVVGLLIGRWLERMLGGGIAWTAALIVVGVIIGLWGAWKWMQRL